jgi:predicted amidohydrolase YtcJ
LSFRDAHTHLAAGSADLLDLDLRDVGSPEHAVEAVARAAAGAPAGGWLRGWGWGGAPLPRDPAPAHAIFLSRRDGHAAWVNDRARDTLGLAGPSGVVAESAFESAKARLPERSAAERIAAVRATLGALAAAQVLAADDMVEPWAPGVYARLRDARELPVAIGMWLPDGTADTDAEAVRRAFPESDRELAVRGVKIFLDGTLHARTAALWEPYADRPDTRGDLRMSAADARDRVRAWASRGWAVAIHAIGDRAVSVALDALEAADRPRWGAHRIEHVQVVRRGDLTRFARGGIVASLQPRHVLDDRPWAAARLGERANTVAYPLASLARAGASIVLGSDWPVSDWNPALILAAASDRRRGDEAVGAAAAAAWYTSGPR